MNANTNKRRILSLVPGLEITNEQSDTLANKIKTFAFKVAQNDTANAVHGPESGYYLEDQWEKFTEATNPIYRS